MSPLAQRLQAVHRRIADAAERAGRTPEEITLVCVSKGSAPEIVSEAAALGESSFGENRVDEFLYKHDNIKAGVDWHWIGQLQSNKVRKIIGKTCLIHSVDRPSLAEEISRRSLPIGVITDILIQVDLLKREGRGGAGEKEALALAETVAALPGLRLRGLMNIAPPGMSTIETERNFARVKALFDRIYTELHDVDFSVLSMGMSGDFEAAIAHGSTLVRIGTAIFGSRR